MNKTNLPRYLVYCNSKHKCDELQTEFHNWGIDTVAYHSNLSQADRDWNFNQFKEGNAKCMFATDLASRGLDIPQVGLGARSHLLFSEKMAIDAS